MDKYKIHYIFHEKNDMNDIFINVLNKELKKFILSNCKDKKRENSSSNNCLNLERGNN